MRLLLTTVHSLVDAGPVSVQVAVSGVTLVLPKPRGGLAEMSVPVLGSGPLSFSFNKENFLPTTFSIQQRLNCSSISW